MLGQKAKHIEKSKRKRGSPVVYRKPLPMRMIYSSLLPLFLLPMLGLGGSALILVLEGELAGAVFAAIFSYVFCVGLWWVVNFAFINGVLVFPDGLAYHFDGYHVFACWDDLESFGYRKTHQGRAWGIVLNQRVDLSQPRVDALLSSYGSKPDILHTFIPLSLIVSVKYEWILSTNVDVSHFRSTSLGQDLLYYAPHLFEKSKQKAKE